MTKKNWVMRIGAILLVLTLATCCLLSSTMARYISEVTGTATATRALWSWEINDTALTAGSTTYTFNLFDTIKDTDGATEETDVSAGKIAPGTSGSFDLKIENKSEVNATYALTFEATNPASIPIEFSTDDGRTWTSNLADANVAATPINIGAEAVTKTIQWRWAYNGDGSADVPDTAIGFGTVATTVDVSLTATFTQVD